MKRFLQITKKTLLIFLVLAIHSMITALVCENFIRPFLFLPTDYAENVNDPTPQTSVPIPVSIPPVEPTIVPPEVVPVPTPDVAAPDALMIPVAGVKREQLQDTFNDARSEGRVHNAIDIMAPVGTPVFAAADGEIAKFFDSERGGITIYQFSANRKFVYYYAHLQKRADHLAEKDSVKRGTVIGYVGDTGNSGNGNYHLHFTVTVLADAQRYWEGTDINPYPLLKDGIESR